MKSIITGIIVFLVFNGFFSGFAVYVYQSLEEFRILAVMALAFILLLLNFQIVYQHGMKSAKDFFIAFDKGFFG